MMETNKYITEPNIEKIRKKVYDEWKKVYDESLSEVEDLAYKLYSPKIDEAYQRGLKDAWEAARKIPLNVNEGGLSANALMTIFGNKSIIQIFKEFSASEVTEKIRQYEQEQEEIKAGDEVENIQTGVRFIVTHTWVSNHGEKGVSGFNYDCSAFSPTIDLVRKTGRYFPEIAEVFRKMLEGKE